MYSNCCRIGDIVIGTCDADAPDHPRSFTGTWTTGSPNVTADGLSVVRIGDIGITDCGHTFQAVAAGENVYSNGLGQVRVGDPVIVLEGGEGIATTGSPNVIST